jgi:hypothetical protein
VEQGSDGIRIMSEVKTPVSGGGADEGGADGVSGAPDGNNVGGRTPGGESGGGGYDNPHADKEPAGDGFMGHGGQTSIDYHGGGQSGDHGGDAPNAATGSDSSDGEERGTDAWAAPVYEPHPILAAGHRVEVVETNGVAQAEQLGNVGKAAHDDAEKESPGGG